MNQLASALLLSAGWLLIPLGIWFALDEPRVWQERLVIPRFDNEPNRHTPIFVTGTFLPPVITKNQTLTAADNPVIVAKTVTVPVGVTLTIQPGTRIYAQEYALIDVKGVLIGEGAEFSSNEQHPENQVWGGVVFEAGAQGTLGQTSLKAAYPGIACLPGSQVTVDGANCVY